MAAYNVSTVQQLVDAILDANTNGQNDVIELAAGVYDLSDYDSQTRGSSFTIPNTTVICGLPLVTTNITLVAVNTDPDQTVITRTGTTEYGLLYIASSGTLTVQNLTLTRGKAGGGGAVDNKGTVILQNCKLGPANEGEYGGAFVNDGTATVTHCVVYQNGGRWGGGILSGTGSMTIEDSLIEENYGIDGGGIINFTTLLVDNCIIRENHAICGAGVAGYNGTATVLNCTITANHSDGAALYTRNGAVIIAHGNCIFDNDVSASNFAVWNQNDMGNPATDNILDASGNWWGTQDGAKAADALLVDSLDRQLVDVSDPMCYPPCGDNGDGTVTFTYRRRAAAAEAIRLTTKNFKPYVEDEEGFPEDYTDVADVVGRIEVGGVRDYFQSLKHKRGHGTGSSIFISECIFAGGMPMINRADRVGEANCDNTDTDGHPSGGAYTLNSWRYCANDQSASLAWKSHPALRDYFTNDPNGLGGESLGSVTRSQIDELIYRTPVSSEPDDPAGTLKSGTEFEAAKQALINTFNTPPLSVLQAGDYVFVPSSGDNHGFLVVGWGPIRGVQEGIDYALNHQLSLYRAELNAEHVIPYIADFNFGTVDQNDLDPDEWPRDSEDADDRTGWYQDPRPRPFYSSAVIIIGEGNLHPDQVDLLRVIHYPLHESPLVVAYQEFDAVRWDF